MGTMDSEAGGRSNRLIGETSPYLLQHAHNPVDWYPWAAEALQRSRDEEKPIFLSIGYSACHWCHVMERESFEDEEIARVMNEFFINVKVDREERPDLDEIYMKAVQAMTGQGGWPMSVFLTPELEPFFGGTYFPPTDRHGRPGFPSLLHQIHRLWESDRERARTQGAALAEHIRSEGEHDLSGKIAADALDRSLSALAAAYDPEWGGFSPAPKFPHATDIRLMLRHWKRTGNDRALEMTIHTLDSMAAGGLNDHLAGGFARYSTDTKWLIPHFEKMLYDNALLAPAYLEAFLATGEARHAGVATTTLDWMIDEMQTPEGGLASSLDADSEGVEGKFYVWTPAELRDVLGDELGRWAAAWWGVTESGNFEEGKSALWRPEPAAEVAEKLGVDPGVLGEALAEARTRLLAARAERIAPGKDDKVLAAWNGLAISALAQGHQVLGELRFLEAAIRVANFLLGSMRGPDGGLLATSRAGRAHLDAYLDDHAFLIQGLLDLYESDFDTRWIEEALALNEVLSSQFEDRERGGYFTTASSHESLIARLKSMHDGALPSGAGVQALNLLRLGALTGDANHTAHALRAMESLGRLAAAHPRALSQLFIAVDFAASDPREVVLSGNPGSEAYEKLLATVRGVFSPQRVVARAEPGADDELIPLLAGKDGVEARVFVCRAGTCGAPISNRAELLEQLG